MIKGAGQGPLTIVNAHVFDGSKARAWSSVRIVDGLISSCGNTSQAEPDDEVLDVAGGWLVPGLIDAHTHLLPGALAQAAVFGVTTELDMFSKPDLVARCKAEAANDASVADVRSAGIGATAPGGHPSMMYAPFPTLTRPEEAANFVAARQAEGSDFLKIMVESGTPGSFEMPALDQATVAALCTAARTRDMVVVAHATSTTAVAGALEAGVDVIAHVPVDGPLPDQLLHRMAERGVAVCPTLATIENALGEPGGLQLAADPLLRPFLGPRWISVLEASASGWRAAQMPSYDVTQDNVARLIDAGIPLLAGTDSPNPGTVHGASLHRELALLGDAGLTPAQALTAATQAPAERFGLVDRGAIEPGRRADLLLLRRSPLDDLGATRDLQTIWRGGQCINRDGYVDSPAEDEQHAALATQVAKVMAAVAERWPSAPIGPQP